MTAVDESKKDFIDLFRMPPNPIDRLTAYGNLPRAVVEVRVPRRPGAVEGKRQLLVVLVLLTPKPKGLEHFDLYTRKLVSL